VNMRRCGTRRSVAVTSNTCREREFFIDNLLVRIHLVIEMIWWTSLAPWEFEFTFPGNSLSIQRRALCLRVLGHLGGEHEEVGHKTFRRCHVQHLPPVPRRALI